MEEDNFSSNNNIDNHFTQRKLDVNILIEKQSEGINYNKNPLVEKII